MFGLPLADANNVLDAGDLLLYRRQPGGLISRMITVAGRSEYTHAALLGCWDGDWMVLETVQFGGCRAVSLVREVERHPGVIDVYRTLAPLLVRRAAVRAMRLETGRRYGWGSLLRLGLTYAPVLRFFFRPSADDAHNGSLPVCSQAVSRALRAAGVDPVPNCADNATSPGDLARSSLFSYKFTLI